MGMCKGFFEDATKFQNGRQRSTPIFLWAQKLQNLESERYGDVQVTFSRFYWNSKWPPQINFNLGGGGGGWEA